MGFFLNDMSLVEWLKTTSPNCKAKIVEPFLNIGEEDKSLPYMYF